MKKSIALALGTLLLGTMTACGVNPNGRAEVDLAGQTEAVNVLCGKSEGKVVVASLGTAKMTVAIVEATNKVDTLAVRFRDENYISIEPEQMNVTVQGNTYEVTGDVVLAKVEMTQPKQLRLRAECGGF